MRGIARVKRPTAALAALPAVGLRIAALLTAPLAGAPLAAAPLAGALIAGALLTGCNLGPDYARPAVPTPELHRGATETADRTTLADMPWWELFQDRALHDLIHEALENNYELRIAAARVSQARAVVGVQHSFLLPQLDVGVIGSRQQLSEDVFGSSASTAGKTFNNFQAGAAVNWELDLFGRLSRAEEAATADYFASEEARQGVVLLLVADVAQAYFTLREFDLELKIAQGTAETRRGTLDLFTKRLLGGVANRLETTNAEADLAEALARIPQLEQQIAQQENLLSFLVGRNPGDIARGATLTDQYQPPELPVGLPSELMERRPDVRLAEENLIAANARVGIAKADFFPKLSLTGFLGGVSTDLGDVFDAGSAAWNFGGSLLQPVFQGGRLTSQQDLALAQWQEAGVRYEQVAQGAFREVADAIVAIDKLAAQRAERERRVAVLIEALQLAQMRYESGFSNYLEVLDSDRQLFSAKNDLAGTQGRQLIALVQLYRSLGGGWDGPEPSGAEETP